MTIAFGVSASLAGALADRPAADPNQVGRYYTATDEGLGVTYRDSGADWVYCGGRRYKSYVALLSQTGTSAPTAVVLENTLGAEVVFDRYMAGIYQARAASAVFTEGKTLCLISAVVFNYSATHLRVSRGSSTTVNLTSTNDGNNYIDDGFVSTSIEIRVYS